MPQSWLYMAKKLEDAEKFSEILSLSRDNIPPEDKYEMEFIIAKSYFAIEEFERAEQSLCSLLSQEEHAAKEDNGNLFINIALFLGVCRLRMEKYSESIVSLKTAKGLFEKEANDDVRDDEILELGAKIYFYLAESFRLNNQTKDALECFSTAQNFYEQLGDERSKVQVLKKKGVLYNSINEYKESEIAFNAAIKLLENSSHEKDLKDLIADLKAQLGVALMKQDRVRPAITEFNNALSSYIKNTHSLIDVVPVQFMLGLCYLRLNDEKAAESYFNLVFSVFDSPDIPMDELKKACTFINWVTHGEEIKKDFLSNPAYNKSSLERLAKVRNNIQELFESKNSGTGNVI